MSSPQLENGYTKIANELLEAICRINLSPYESRLLWCIIRKTYGFNKKQDWISQSQLHEITGIHKAHLSRAKKKLLDKNIVTQTGNKIGLNKVWTTWSELPKQVTIKKLPKQVTPVTQTGNLELPKQAYTKETITKETIQKKNINANSNELAPVNVQKTLLPNGITYERVFIKYETLSNRKVIVREKWKPKIKAVFNSIHPDIINKAWYMMSIDEWLRGTSQDSNGKDYFTIEYALRQQNIEKYYNNFISYQQS